MDKLHSYFDGELKAREKKELEAELDSNSELQAELASLKAMRTGIQDWHARSFVDDEGKPMAVSLWDGLEDRLDIEDKCQRSFFCRLKYSFGQLIDWFSFRPQQLAFAGSLAIVVALFIVWQGGQGKERDYLVENERYPYELSTVVQRPAVSEFTLVSTDGFLSHNRVRAYNLVSQVDFEPRPAMRQRSFGQVHTAGMDVEWLKSDRSVSFLNASYKSTPPVIWVANRNR